MAILLPLFLLEKTEMSEFEAGEDLLDAETREKLESEHKRIITINHQGGTFVFRYPKRPEVRRFKDMVQKDDADAGEKLVRALVVHPSREAFSEFLDDYPFAADPIFLAIAKASGFSANVAAK